MEIQSLRPVSDWFVAYRDKESSEIILERLIGWAEVFDPNDTERMIQVDGLTFDVDGMHNLAAIDAPSNYEFLGYWHRDDIYPKLFDRRWYLDADGGVAKAGD